MFLRRRLIARLAGCFSRLRGAARAQTPALELRHGDSVILLGNTLAERMQYF